MIKKNNKEVGFIEKGTTNIDKIYKGTNLVFEQGFDREDSGSTPLTTSHEAIGKNLLDYKVYGNSVQNGTPTPSTPIEIESVGDKSKNILDKSQALVQEIREETQFSAWATLTFSNAWVTANLKPDTTYTISYDVECINVPDYDTRYSNMVGFYLYSGVSGYSNVDMYTTQYMTSGETLRIEKTITTPSGLLDTSANYRILAYTNRYLKNSVGVMSAMIFKNIQIEEGSNASEYEPYGYKIPVTASDGTNSTTFYIYLTQQLRKIGDYADYIDFVREKVIRNIKEITLNGSENWAKYPSTNTNTYYIAISDSIKGFSTSLCNRFKNIPYGAWQSSISDGLYSDHSSLNYKYFRTPDNNTITTLEEFKNWLSIHNANLTYTLNTPTEEDIELPIIPSIKGTTIYSVGTQVQPSNMYIKYKGR